VSRGDIIKAFIDGRAVSRSKTIDFGSHDSKTSHNESIISGVMYVMLAKIRCGTSIDETRVESGII
jgi:hypothetical protein